MAGLDDTTARRVRKRRHGAASASDGDAGLVEVRGFGFNPGALRMLAHVPAGLPPGAALVVVLHGCTQRAGAHARAAGWVDLADRLGFALIAPEQDVRNNPNRCFNWFEPGDTARDAGEAASIRSMIEHLAAAEAIDRARVFVTGLSAGGAMAAVMLAAYPETFAGGAVVAGLPFGVARSMPEAFAAMRGSTRVQPQVLGDLVSRAAPTPPRFPRLSVWHGLADSTVASANARALAGQWAAVHGLTEEADETLERGHRTRSVWRDATGVALIECNLLRGIGHGTPLQTTGDDAIGQTGPFMLEAGVSSSLEIARFWGLAPEDPAAHAGWAAAKPAPAGHATSGHALGETVMAAVSPHTSRDIQDVIAAALGAAGLLR